MTMGPDPKMGPKVYEMSHKVMKGSEAIFMCHGKCSQRLNEWSSFSVFKLEVILSEHCTVVREGRLQYTRFHFLHSLQLSLSLSLLCTCRYWVVCLGSWGCLGRCPVFRTGIWAASEKSRKPKEGIGLDWIWAYSISIHPIQFSQIYTDHWSILRIPRITSVPIVQHVGLSRCVVLAE